MHGEMRTSPTTQKVQTRRRRLCMASRSPAGCQRQSRDDHGLVEYAKGVYTYDNLCISSIRTLTAHPAASHSM